MTIAYYDSCPECDSMNTRITEDNEDGTFLVYCYDCGAEWEDSSD